MSNKKEDLLVVVRYLITQFCLCLPLRSVPSFLRLYFGVLSSQGGHVTSAILGYKSEVSWSAHYKWLQRSSWRGEELGLGSVRVLVELLKHWGGTLYLVLDDTVIERASRKAPGVKFHHQHSNKPNRPTFLNGQCVLSLMGAVRMGCGRVISLPFVHKLYKGKGNDGKLVLGAQLLELVSRVISSLPRCLLMDCWFMKRSLLEAAREKGIQVIGQVRIDTDLREIHVPPQKRKRGRPQKFGKRITLRAVKQVHKKLTKVKLSLYGKEQVVIYRSEVCYAHFLGTIPVRVVWVAFLDDENAKHSKAKWKLLLSTDTSLTPIEIIQRYEMRWSIEPEFFILKHIRGFKEAWQQREDTFLRWIHILRIFRGSIAL